MIFGYEEDQIQWLQNETLVLPSDWTVMLFSHDAPFSALLFDEKTALEKNDIVNGNQIFSALDQCRKQYGFDVAGWFIGHYHGDRIVTLFGVPFVITASETPMTRSCLTTTCASGKGIWARRAKISGMRSF